MGAQSLIKNLQKVSDNFSNSLEAAVKSGALLVQNDAKKMSPYKTGNLSSSIHIETAEKSNDKVEVRVGTDVIYARTQEYGRGNIPAHPFMRPAFDMNQENIQKEIIEALKDLT